MEEKHKSLDISNQKTKITLDPCPVCSEELFYDEDVTKRVGILGKQNDIEGWLCPFCRSEFDMEGEIVRFFRDGKITGDA